MRNPLTFARSTLVDETEVVAVSGGFDGQLVTGLEFTGLLNECIEARKHLILDLSDTDFIDSSGLGVLHAAHRRLADVGRGLALLSPRPHVARVLHTTGLDDVLLTVGSAEEARAALTGLGGDRPASPP